MMKKKINSLINTIFPLITIFFLYLGIKSDGGGSFIKGFSIMISDIFFWYIIAGIIILTLLILFLLRKEIFQNKK